MENKRFRLGDVLQGMGYVSAEQIDRALEYQQTHRGMRIGDALIALNFITEPQMLEALAKHTGSKTVDLDSISVDINAVMKVPRQMAERNLILPVSETNGVLHVITNDPTNFYGLEDVRQTTGQFLEIELCEKESLERAIAYYYADIEARQAASKANQEFQQTLQQISEADSDLDGTPVTNLIDRLLTQAYSSGASDIHIEPFENKTQIRMRIDGMITDFVSVLKNVHASLIARVKIMADMDIAEKRVPQDGHFRFNVNGNSVNIRVSMIPTVFGEKAVLRLLGSTVAIDNSGTFGMNRSNFERFSGMLKKPNGIIYITGPTGSGKSTTLYMILAHIAKQQVNISTIEDPVEKNIDRINQMQVNNLAGLTFESGLRALLRQDPDVIMVGETRDNETAAVSVRAAITGHVVFSTLHTNDAASSIARLIDMGIEPYLIASSLNGIVAQRLVKKVCPFCAVESEPTESEKAYLGTEIQHVKHAKGCHLCNYTGYHGRIAIHEVLNVDETLRGMIARSATTDQIKRYAQQQGMQLLKDSGVALVQKGITTVEEISRVAYYT